ncbi:MAG: hypothetical protein RM049_37320 [Nostoc sp. DedQUE04]|nr:hypothetical protein [Nostoc sp. DedQUE04]MDZ8140890.1 hypothetical protein [Nostoc sp. DedQUE04]
MIKKIVEAALRAETLVISADVLSSQVNQLTDPEAIAFVQMG